MTKAAADFWERAKEALLAARRSLAISPDAAASRAYYAAFYAVSAWFVFQDKIHYKHTAVEAAVHRDLVKAGVMATDFGSDYSKLLRLRVTGDYGVGEHVTPEEAADALECAARILKAVAKANSFFRLEPSDR
jgi:uncharacterized protein (UPF0332 family)